MKSEILKKILDETPKETKIFVSLYGRIVTRIHQLIESKGYTQKKLASKLDKRPSEINKWLNGEHNLTLRTIAKLQAVLDADIINIPKSYQFTDTKNIKVKSFTVYRNTERVKGIKFSESILKKAI